MVLSHPVLDTGIFDDWSYIWTAKHLAETGTLQYNGFATAMLGWQVYAGALVIKLFGFSWLGPRLVVMASTLIGLAIFHRTLVRLGCSDRDAAMITLGLSCSNLFLLHAVTFMTDLTGWMVIVLCLYLCLRALQTSSDDAAAMWIAAASLSNLLLGTVRQIVWLGALVMVPAVVWALRTRKPRAFRVGLAASGISFLGIALWMRWWKHVPYAVQEKLFFLHYGQIRRLPIFTVTLFGFGAPLLIAFIVYRKRLWPSLLGAALGCGAVLMNPFMGTPFGLGMIDPAMTVPRPVALLISAVVFASGFAFLDVLYAALRERRSPKSSGLAIDDEALFWLLIPFSLALLILLYTRGALWPRYWFSMLPVLGVGIAWVMRRSFPGRELPRMCGIFILVSFASAIVLTHDIFSLGRGLSEAEKTYLASGLPRNQLEASFQSDGIWEIQTHGYVNDPRIITPRGAAFVPAHAPLPLECLPPMWEFMPHLDRRYALVTEPGGCYQPSGLPTVEYGTWYPPFRHTVFIAKLTPSSVQP